MDSTLFDNMKSEADWNAYFRELWTGVLNEDTIKEFEKTYKG